MKVVTLDSIVAVIRARRGYKGFLHKFIEECEIVDAIPIPDNATNGDVIKAMFPNIESRLDEKTGIILVKWTDGTTKTFKASWWDAPYKGV